MVTTEQLLYTTEISDIYSADFHGPPIRVFQFSYNFLISLWQNHLITSLGKNTNVRIQDIADVPSYNIPLMKRDYLNNKENFEVR